DYYCYSEDSSGNYIF
nr:immunoglobulin light chain junction region [Macaca mulatta]MOW04288.1 immunoglobulin light chain junction region [Macaca mulatta]MOW05054.1 immunoglobulin light chain junction region [Macaca mulatta]MOW05248.1 immunoglobulin light chain junction region [Macaca mulatta]MOW05289.1 immunoglobulin light chain junction region [Macaca mulatta]